MATKTTTEPSIHAHADLQNDALCGERRGTRRMTSQQADEVTCGRCKRLIEKAEASARNLTPGTAAAVDEVAAARKPAAENPEERASRETMERTTPEEAEEMAEKPLTSYRVRLAAIQNPDMKKRRLPKPSEIVVGSLEEASIALRAWIEEHSLGGGNMAPDAGMVFVNDLAKPSMHISYNGRAWSLHKGGERGPEIALGKSANLPPLEGDAKIAAEAQASLEEARAIVASRDETGAPKGEALPAKLAGLAALAETINETGVPPAAEPPPVYRFETRREGPSTITQAIRVETPADALDDPLSAEELAHGEEIGVSSIPIALWPGQTRVEACDWTPRVYRALVAVKETDIALEAVRKRVATAKKPSTQDRAREYLGKALEAHRLTSERLAAALASKEPEPVPPLSAAEAFGGISSEPEIVRGGSPDATAYASREHLLPPAEKDEQAGEIERSSAEALREEIAALSGKLAAAKKSLAAIEGRPARAPGEGPGRGGARTERLFFKVQLVAESTVRVAIEGKQGSVEDLSPVTHEGATALAKAYLAKHAGTPEEIGDKYVTLRYRLRKAIGTAQ